MGISWLTMVHVLQKTVKYNKPLQRYQSSVQKGLWAGELICLGYTAPCFSNMVCSIAFLSIVLIGTSSGKVINCFI